MWVRVPPGSLNFQSVETCEVVQRMAECPKLWLIGGMSLINNPKTGKCAVPRSEVPSITLVGFILVGSEVVKRNRL